MKHFTIIAFTFFASLSLNTAAQSTHAEWTLDDISDALGALGGAPGEPLRHQPILLAYGLALYHSTCQIGTTPVVEPDSIRMGHGEHL